MSILIDLRMKSITHTKYAYSQSREIYLFTARGSLYHWFLDGDIEMIVDIIKLLAIPVICYVADKQPIEKPNISVKIHPL